MFPRDPFLIFKEVRLSEWPATYRYGSTLVSYYVSCAACSLELTMDDVEEILDLQSDHQDEHTDRHILEFERM